MNPPSPFQPAHSPCPWCDPLGRLGSPFTVYFCRPFLLRCPSSFLHFFVLFTFFVPSSLCNYMCVYSRNDDTGSALRYMGVWSYVLIAAPALRVSEAEYEWSLFIFFIMCSPSIRLCCPFAHSWVEPRVEQTIHVAFIIVETRLTFHQLLVAFISRFKLTLSPCNFIWPHFLVCKWGLESRYVFLSPFLCVEFFVISCSCQCADLL